MAPEGAAGDAGAGSKFLICAPALVSWANFKFGASAHADLASVWRWPKFSNLAAGLRTAGQNFNFGALARENFLKIFEKF